MLRNRCLNYLRDRKPHWTEKKVHTLEENELQYLFQLDFMGKEEASMEEQLLLSIQQSVDKLPEKRKEVFIKAKMEGKKNKEVADELGISVKAVEKHLNRAKEQIRQEMLLKFPLLSVLILIILE